MFKYEMHLHSSGPSACGSSDSVEYVKIAKEKGYAGMVFTNHFFRGNTAISRDLPWRDFVRAYEEDFLRAYEVGQKEDIDVIFGIEEGIGSGKECLIYGLTPDIIASEPSFSKLPIEELSVFVRENGGLIAAAHPYRQRNYITNPTIDPDPTLYDAIEVYNRGNALEENETAERFAKKHGLLPISGGDVHSVGGFGFSGVALPERARNGKELVCILKSGNYSLIARPESGNVGSLFEYIL